MILPLDKPAQAVIPGLTPLSPPTASIDVPSATCTTIPTGHLQCIKCSAIQPKSEHYRNAAAKSGYRGECKTCSKAHDASEKRRAKRRKYSKTKTGKEAHRRATKTYRSNNPKKRACHVAVGRAIRSGELVRPDCCEVCSSTDKLYAHHDDYNEPLTVRWLCNVCHINWHITHGEGANASPDIEPGDFPDIDIPGF